LAKVSELVSEQETRAEVHLRRGVTLTTRRATRESFAAALICFFSANPAKSKWSGAEGKLLAARGDDPRECNHADGFHGFLVLLLLLFAAAEHPRRDARHHEYAEPDHHSRHLLLVPARLVLDDLFGKPAGGDDADLRPFDHARWFLG
jgi:hypothetical protein